MRKAIKGKTIKLIVCITVCCIGTFVLGWHFGTRYERKELSKTLIDYAASGRLILLPKEFMEEK